MSSFLCFLCHSTVHSDTREDIREKYREIVGINLCPDSHLCHVCCHMLNKLWLFKSVCLKRSLEYPVLFSEKGTINLQQNEIEQHILCPEDVCQRQQQNNNQFNFHHNDEDTTRSNNSNEYVELEDDRNEKDDFNDYIIIKFESENNDLSSELKETNIPNELEDKCNDNLGEDIYKDDSVIDGYNDNESFDFEMSKVCQNGDDEVHLEENNEDFNDAVELLEKGNTEDREKSKKKTKSKKRKKNYYQKIVLSLEEQKYALDAQRKGKKYIEAEFKCHNCALGFLFKDTYQAHMMRHEESNGEYRCDTCSLRFATQAVLRTHIALHSERYRCMTCDKTLRVRQRQTHARRCHRKESDAAACHLCGNVFKDASGLQQHLKRFHHSKTSNRSYPCSVCGKTYNNQAAVRTHMIKHIHRKFTCDICESAFSSPYTLNQHKKKHAQIEPESQHYCSTCGLGYNTRKSLLAHKRNALNHQQRAFECSLCSRVCPNQKALASHINTVHASSKDFSCPYCPARYTGRKSLVRHIGGHGQRKPPRVATCHLCGKHFKGNSKLNRHLREVCEKEKLEEELASYYEQHIM